MNKVRARKIRSDEAYKAFLKNRDRRYKMTEAEQAQVLGYQRQTQAIIQWLAKLPDRLIGGVTHQKVLRKLDCIDEAVRKIKKVPRREWNAEDNS